MPSIHLVMPSIHLVIYFLIYCQLPEGILSLNQEEYAEAYKPVMIGDTAYSVVELPDSETKIVADEHRKLLGHIDLRSLVKNLGHVGRCIQLVNNGMAAAGPDPEYVKLQQEVQHFGYNVTRLCAKSADTLSNFKRELTTILNDLQPMYEYLLDGSEDLARETLSRVYDKAGEFANAAKELCNSFNEGAYILEQILKKTRETEADKGHTAIQREADQENQAKKCEHEHELHKRAQEERKKAEERYSESESQEEAAIKNLDDTKRSGVFPLALKIVGIASLEQSQDSKERQLFEFQKKKEDAQKILTEKEKKEEQAFLSMTECIAMLKYYKSKVELAKSSVEALHQALGGLKPLTTTMMQSAFFWKRMEDHYKALNNSKLKDTVVKEMHKHSDEQRRNLWISMPFKKQVVIFNAGWVALDGVCGECMGSIEETQEELYKYLKENPTQEEAKKNIPSLAAKFRKDIQEACTKENSECRRR